ncbi:hypothetical protein [Winogradskyella sp.]|uniref:hypothetical protein n=1 Tax=Winogradskyella sp. TaxID=1883156 RepID=UPI0026047061|nr:hypothetical protein [Winogradskyella sp.]
MTEQQADKIFQIVEDDIYDLVKTEIGFKHLALKKENDNFYYLEFSYNKEKLNETEAKNLKDKINSYFLTVNTVDTLLIKNIELFTTEQRELIEIDESFKSIPKRELESFLKIDAENIVASEAYEFYSNHKKDKQKNDAKVILKAGDTINNDGESGTLGAIIKLDKISDYFIVSNHHVIAHSGKCTGSVIKDSLQNGIATLYWGIFNKTHDIALAKVCNSKNIIVESGTPIHNFGKIIKPSLDMKDCASWTNSREKSGGMVYSSRAIVRIKSNLFKDQILLKDLYLKNGNSGSIIVSKNGSDTPNVIGICVGGNLSSKIDIANKLSNLFHREITPSNTNNCLQIHSVNFKSFH